MYSIKKIKTFLCTRSSVQAGRKGSWASSYTGRLCNQRHPHTYKHTPSQAPDYMTDQLCAALNMLLIEYPEEQKQSDAYIFVMIFSQILGG